MARQWIAHRSRRPRGVRAGGRRRAALPGPGEVTVACAHRRLNPADAKHVAEGNTPADFPRPVGYEVAGVVTAIGPDTELASGGGAIGDEVLAFRVRGGWAAELTIPARDVFAKPPGPLLRAGREPAAGRHHRLRDAARDRRGVTGRHGPGARCVGCGGGDAAPAGRAAGRPGDRDGESGPLRRRTPLRRRAGRLRRRARAAGADRGTGRRGRGPGLHRDRRGGGASRSRSCPDRSRIVSIAAPDERAADARHPPDRRRDAGQQGLPRLRPRRADRPGRRRASSRCPSPRRTRSRRRLPPPRCWRASTPAASSRWCPEGARSIGDRREATCDAPAMLWRVVVILVGGGFVAYRFALAARDPQGPAGPATRPRAAAAHARVRALPLGRPLPAGLHRPAHRAVLAQLPLSRPRSRPGRARTGVPGSAPGAGDPCVVDEDQMSSGLDERPLLPDPLVHCVLGRPCACSVAIRPPWNPPRWRARR